MVFSVVDEIEVSAASGTLYEHGWQSWSPTRTYPLSHPVSERPQLHWQQLMRYRPETPAPAEGFQAEGLLVVDPGTSGPCRVYSVPDPVQAVPSVRARLVGDRLVVTSDGPVRTDEVAGGIETALERFGDEAAGALGVALRLAPTVWCSWYYYFLDVTEQDILENLAAIDTHGFAVDVVQIDDGWQAGVGDWLELSGRFSSLSELAGRIRDTGRRAGIWVAPFIAGAQSRLARDHPDWLVGEAGHNWDQDLLGVDLTHPGARDYVWTVFRRLRELGFDYFKLDFLYGGALPGRRYEDVTGVTAYRSGLEVIRDAIGPESYLLGCGAPILPSIGLVDGMRVSPDTYHPTDSGDEQRRLRGRDCAVARAWQQGRLWVNDADCLVARPSFAARREWAEVIERYGGLRSASDRLAELDDWGLETTRRLLATAPPPTPFPPEGSVAG